MSVGVIGMPNTVRVQPSWAQKNGAVPMYSDDPSHESPGVTDSVGSGSMHHMTSHAPLSQKKKVDEKVAELTCCERCFFGGCFGGDTSTHQVPPAMLASGAAVEQGGIILLGNGAIAIFSDHMPEMEDCFYAGMGVVHVIMALAFIGLGVASLIVESNLRYSFAGVWCGAPVVAAAVMSFIVAKKEMRRDVKKLIVCVVLSLFAGIAFGGISYMSATVDGYYERWDDIKDDQHFKMRCIVDMISMVIGPLETVLCIGHLSSLISNLRDECTFRCCPKRRFRKFLKEESKRHEQFGASHLKKKKELMYKLIADLEEEELYKERWRNQHAKLLANKSKEDAAWDMPTNKS